MNTPPEITPISVQPIDEIDIVLRNSFAKDISDQVMRLDDLAKQLITLNLAIPAIYGVVLKLTLSDKASLTRPMPFVFWAFALFFAFLTLMPIKQSIDRDSLSAIENYFCETARRKWWLIFFATLFSFSGICSVLLSIFTI